MKSCMWFPWCLETAIGDVCFDGAAVEELLRHLRAAPPETAVWVINGGDLEEGFKVNSVIEKLPLLADLKRTTKVRRIVLVSTHIFAKVGAEQLEEATGIRAFHYADRGAAHRWVQNRCL